MLPTGYGNQAPVTFEGRNLVIVAGIFSLILFAAVLGTAGYVLTAIFDDIVGRFWLAAPLKKPGVGVIVWGAVWLVYARSIGHDVLVGTGRSRKSASRGVGIPHFKDIEHSEVA